MTDSSQLQNLTLNPSDTVLSFPPHRRRPLRSRTYDVLVGILSVCHTNFTQLQTQVDGTGNELRPMSEKNGSITCNEDNSTDVLPPNSKDSDDAFVQETSVGVNKENHSLHDGGFDDKLATIPKLDNANSITEVEQEVVPANKMSICDSSVVENQKGDCAIQIANEQENVNSVLDIQMDDFGTLGELQVDKDFGIHELSEVLDSCFGMDMVVESSKTGEDSQDNGSAMKENIPSEAERELQQKTIELEKLIYNSDLMESSPRLNDDEEIEEGEISGEAGVADASLDALSEDAESLGERTKEKVHAFEDSCSKEEFICNSEDRGCRQREMSDPSPCHIVNTDCNSMKLESRPTTRQMQECYSTFLNDSHTETQRSGPIPPCLESLTPSAKTLPENAAENRTSATTEQDGDVRKRKRKGPLTKERRAKKKKKERIKRAEKNRQLGVKRLKLQPVLKPKTVTYCRHYLQGRCHEGVNCKFSHDTVPLTKSKPCCHFARQSCMKGDDCPFDHQLSKYPCKNYTSNGFCPRGTACLFSHEMPSGQSLPTTPNVSKSELTSSQNTMPDKGTSFKVSKVTKPEMKLPSTLNNSNSSKHTINIDTFHQKVDARFCSTGNSPGKSAELLSKPVPRTSGQTPKGVSFLLNGSSVKTSDRVDVAHETNVKVPGSINKNEMSEKVTPRKPRGINFLSFAQPSSNDSSNKMISNMLLKSDNGLGKSVIDDRNEGRLSCSLVESGCLGDPVFKGRTNSHFNKNDAGLSSGRERESTSSKLQETIKMPFLSFGGPRDRSTGGQNANLSGSLKTSLLSNTPSSVQKAVQSTLAFAAKFESDIKVGSSSLHKQGS